MEGPGESFDVSRIERNMKHNITRPYENGATTHGQQEMSDFPCFVDKRNCRNSFAA